MKIKRKRTVKVLTSIISKLKEFAGSEMASVVINSDGKVHYRSPSAADPDNGKVMDCVGFVDFVTEGRKR